MLRKPWLASTVLLTRYSAEASHVLYKVLWNGVSMLYMNSEIIPPIQQLFDNHLFGCASIALGYGIARLYGAKDILRLFGITDYLNLWDDLLDLCIRSRRRYRAG